MQRYWIEPSLARSARQWAYRGALHARRREVVHAETVRGVHGVDLVRRRVDEVAAARGDAEVLELRHGVGLEVDHGETARRHLLARLLLVEAHHHHETAVVGDALLHEVGGLLDVREETGLEHPSGHPAVGVHEVDEQRARLGRESRRGREAGASQRGERAAVDLKICLSHVAFPFRQDAIPPFQRKRLYHKLGSFGGSHCGEPPSWRLSGTTGILPVAAAPGTQTPNSHHRTMNIVPLAILPSSNRK